MSGAEKTFTQEAVNGVVQERLRRAREKWEEEALELVQTTRAELERAQHRAETLEEAALRGSFEARAAQRGVHDLDASWRLAQRDLMGVDDNGETRGVAEALDGVLEQRPYLVDRGETLGNADLGTRGEAPHHLTRDDLQRMSSAEVVVALNRGELTHLTG
jgi:hypothetical protein